jgi:hypothetical protein
VPSRAFVPVPLIEAQPRVYKSFRGRQMKGIIIGLGCATLCVMVFGVSNFAGYLMTFLGALPGFAYGYFQPQGKPLEYWLRVLLRYYTQPQILSSAPAGWKQQIRARRLHFTHVVRSVLYLAARRFSRKGRRVRDGR